MTVPGICDTHEVFNQSPPYVGVDLYLSDRPLRDAIAANGVRGDDPALSDFGRHWGSADMAERARLANENRPKLKAFDDRGFRRDIVEFHPAYHQFMADSIGAGMAAMTWADNGQRAAAPAEVARAAHYYMIAQVENGHMCPVTMTRAAIGALAAEPALLSRVMPKISSRRYDPRFIPWTDKEGVTIGMGMTEKQGGTDVRANTTHAAPDGDGYRITGHKWFMSAPMCDLFLVLAQAPGGLTCFLMPRFAPDGSVNGLRFQRLKDKLGNISNASSEVEFCNAFAWRVGEEGRGVRTIIDMVQLTRLDCAVASAGIMRGALTQAIHHARYRTVFQKRLADQPLMATVLADLALESEAACAAAMRLCRAFDLAAVDAKEAARARTLTPVIKYWICKSAPGFVYEAMECLGGNGYVEDGVLARLYREAPVNAIWEGSGNVVCLDLLRALMRDGDAAMSVLEEIAQATGALPGCADAVAFVTSTLAGAGAEARARSAVERLALLCAVEALQARAPEIAVIFAQARLARQSGRSYGAVELAAADVARLVERALPSA